MDNKKIAILIVDDDDVATESVIRAIQRQKLSYEIFVAHDGYDALEVLQDEAFQTYLAQPPLILLDLNMPRMNGHEFLTVLRDNESWSSSVVFVLTTSSNIADQQAAYQKQIAGYMVKSKMGNNYEKLSGFLEKYHETVSLPVIH